MTTQEIVSKLWNLCNVLRDDGITYHQYVTELTYILFLKMAKETDKESKFAEGITLQENKDGQELTPEQKTQNHEKQIVMEYSWDKLISKSGVELYKYYKDLLRLFDTYCTGRVREIYQGAMTNIDEPKNLERSSPLSTVWTGTPPGKRGWATCMKGCWRRTPTRKSPARASTSPLVSSLM